MDDNATNPETGVADAPAEQDFSDFEKSLETVPETEPEQGEEPTEFADDDNPGDPEPSVADDEFEEVEFGGKAYKLPRELKDAVLRQRDYTRKTQEIAEMRKRLEPLVQVAEEASQAETQAQTELAKVAYRMEQLQSTDWSQSDQMTIMQAQIEYQALEKQAERLSATAEQARQHRLSVAQQETALRMEEGRKVLAEKIPDFANKAPRLAEHAMTKYGFSAEDLASVEDPRFFIALNRLVDLEEQVSKQQTALKAAQKVEVKPVQTLKGNSGRTGPRADTNDFLAFEKLADQKIRQRR